MVGLVSLLTLVSVQVASALDTASPTSQGMSAELLRQGIVKLRQGHYGDIDSLLVLRRGKLVLEEYLKPDYYGRDYRQPLRSVTKSFASALIGIAIGQRRIRGVEARLPEFFPQYPTVNHPDSRKTEIMLHDLLSMSAGYQWDELIRHYGDPQNDANRMLRSDDWVKFVLDLPMRDDPGVRPEYNSGVSLLLSAILQHATGQSAASYAQTYLFAPMGIVDWSWPVAMNDLTGTHWGLSMTRRDMARFGQLYLDRGQWQGRQIVPGFWVDASTAEQITGEPDTLYATYVYGYHWWRFRDFDATVKLFDTNDVFFAYGDGGQLILVAPHLELVVVSTANLPGADFQLQFDLVRDHIFAAIRD